MPGELKNIVILTGAGISKESGLNTFRDEDGLWCNHRIEDVATPEAYGRDPDLVQNFYNMRRRQLAEVIPNAAHEALAELEAKWEGGLLLVTQNVDDLHERAGSGRKDGAFLHMHGELKKARCANSGRVYSWSGDLSQSETCECCGSSGYLRPHIVWFGEMPLYMDEIQSRLRNCDLFISIGTSGNVYPAAGFVHEAKMSAGAHTIEINLEPSLVNRYFDESRQGPASKLVPELVGELLGNR